MMTTSNGVGVVNFRGEIPAKNSSFGRVGMVPPESRVRGGLVSSKWLTERFTTEHPKPYQEELVPELARPVTS